MDTPEGVADKATSLLEELDNNGVDSEKSDHKITVADLPAVIHEL